MEGEKIKDLQQTKTQSANMYHKNQEVQSMKVQSNKTEKYLTENRTYVPSLDRKIFFQLKLICVGKK